MIKQIYNFSLDVTWQLIHKMSLLERFDAQWTTIEKREGQSIKHLKLIATVGSVGASTRIEGIKMTNEKVENLLKNLFITLGQLMRRLETQTSRNKLSARAQAILLYIESHPDCRSGQIAASLDIPSSTVKRILSKLYDRHLISRMEEETHPFYEII